MRCGKVSQGRYWSQKFKTLPKGNPSLGSKVSWSSLPFLAPRSFKSQIQVKYSQKWCVARSPRANFDPKSPGLSQKVLLHWVQRFPGPHCPTLRLSPSRDKYRSNTARNEVWQGLLGLILIPKVQDSPKGSHLRDSLSGGRTPQRRVLPGLCTEWGGSSLRHTACLPSNPSVISGYKIWYICLYLIQNKLQI